MKTASETDVDVKFVVQNQEAVQTAVGLAIQALTGESGWNNPIYQAHPELSWSKKLHFFLDAAGKFKLTGRPGNVKARNGHTLIGSITFRSSKGLFVLRGIHITSLFDAFEQAFLHYNQKFVYETSKTK
jgi:hypothetical protein